MARKKKSTVATAVASESVRAAAAAETAVLGADWVATLREVMQDVQTLALERTGYQDASQTHLHTASLAPALRRLRRVFKDEVGFGSALVEENWVLFRDEIWLAIVRVLVTPKLSAAVVHAFGAFFGEFLSAFTPRETARSSTGGGGPNNSSCLKKKRPEDTPTSKARRDRESSLNELRIEVLNRLLDATKAEDKHVRLRVCHFLQLILNKLDFIEYVRTIGCGTRADQLLTHDGVCLTETRCSQSSARRSSRAQTTSSRPCASRACTRSSASRSPMMRKTRSQPSSFGSWSRIHPSTSDVFALTDERCSRLTCVGLLTFAETSVAPQY